MSKGTLIRGLTALALVWGAVWGVTSWSAARKATPEKVTQMVESAEFANWSGGEPDGISEAERKGRLAQLNEIATTLNRLDLREKKQLEKEGDVVALFFRLSEQEKLYLVDRLFDENLDTLMKSFDEMDPKEREKMVDRAVRELTEGVGAEALEKLKKEDPEFLKVIVKKGFKAYFLKASANSKMALLPFLNSVGEIVKGFAKPGRGGL